MRKVWNGIQITLICLLALAILCVALFSAAATFYLNRSGWDLQGYRAFTVETDSAGCGYLTVVDIAVIKITDIGELQTGDVIIYRSEEKESYGKVLVGAIESAADQEETAFVVGSKEQVAQDNVLGKYELTVPYGNSLFQFLKTEKGFILCVVLPVALLLLLACTYSIGNFAHFRSVVRKKLEQEEEESKMLTQEQLDQSCEAAAKIISGDEQDSKE